MGQSSGTETLPGATQGRIILLCSRDMDLFYAGFTNDLAPVRVLRNIGLMAAAHAGVLKRQALKYALGL